MCNYHTKQVFFNGSQIFSLFSFFFDNCFLTGQNDTVDIANVLMGAQLKVEIC